jgi:thiol-disulfide isomerase/thioredoxin
MEKWMHLLWIVPLVIILVFLCYRLAILVIHARYGEQDATIEGLVNGGADKPSVRVMYFYAKWCKFCQDFKPVFEKLRGKADVSFPASSLEAYDVDDAANAELVKTYGVSSLPDIRFITDAGEERYRGERNEVSLSMAIHDAETAALAALAKKK